MSPALKVGHDGVWIGAAPELLFIADRHHDDVPDGAAYFIDWYDTQHCHNPVSERWDRSNGRIYRMQFDATYKSRTVNLATLDEHWRKYSTRHRFGPTTAGPAAITLNASARAAIDFVETESRSARN